jgi:hypothetical protein
LLQSGGAAEAGEEDMKRFAVGIDWFDLGIIRMFKMFSRKNESSLVNILELCGS